MRYTTIIDLTTLPQVYRNTNCRLLYYHMACKAGYHDNDRDLCMQSIRTLAADTGLTVAAVRHALAVLTKHGLLARQGQFWVVKKWVMEQPISKRARTATEQKATTAAHEREAAQRQMEKEMEQNRRKREAAERTGKTPYMLYYEDQVRKAAAGDAEAAEIVRKNKATYEQHKANMAEQQKKQTSK